MERTHQCTVMLCGLPRSGTTWLGKIYDSHPVTLYRHEPDSGGRLQAIPLLASPSLAEEKKYGDHIRGFVANIPYIDDVKVASSLPIFRKSYMSSFAYWKAITASIANQVAAKLALKYQFSPAISKGDPGEYVLVWKSIESTGRLGLFKNVLPAMRIFLIVRHPCGYISSVLRGESSRKFDSSTPTSGDIGMLEMLMDTDQARRRGLAIEDVLKMSAVERLALRWMLFNEKAVDELSAHDECYIVSYDRMCENPVDGARQLLDCSGLEWCKETERFVRYSTARERSGYYSLRKDPSKSAASWQQYLDRELVDSILNIVSGSKVWQLISMAEGQGMAVSPL